MRVRRSQKREELFTVKLRQANFGEETLSWETLDGVCHYYLIQDDKNGGSGDLILTRIEPNGVWIRLYDAEIFCSARNRPDAIIAGSDFYPLKVYLPKTAKVNVRIKGDGAKSRIATITFLKTDSCPGLGPDSAKILKAQFRITMINPN